MNVATPSSARPAIACENVSVRFGDLLAVDRVSLTIAPGEFVSLVGPSGCGKSSLLRVISGLTAATDGTVSVLDQPPAALRKRPGEVAFVFQDATLLNWRTVAENIALPLEIIGRKVDAAAWTIALERVGLEAFADRFPHQLSGGMRMRVSLARALITGPRLLLLDEPFAALDDITRQQLNAELRDLWQAAQFTSVFVTHNIAEAAFMSTRVVVMSARPGRILADIPIPFGADRPPQLRTAPEFAGVCGELSELLRSAHA